jgi:hypothetical protein
MQEAHYSKYAETHLILLFASMLSAVLFQMLIMSSLVRML